jgi:carbonic anhydrase
VLGFLFRVVKDDYFQNEKADDWHDKFMRDMVEKRSTKLDLTAFVKKLNYDRRWTYSGSLTTTPYSEGILWNVIEQVILIRQSTLDKFLQYQKVEEHQMFGQFPNEKAKQENIMLR